MMDSQYDKELMDVLLSEQYYAMKDKQKIIDLDKNICVIKLFCHLCFGFSLLMMVFINFNVLFYFIEPDAIEKNDYEHVIVFETILTAVLLFFTTIAYFFYKSKERELSKMLEVVIE